jgi:hypothetical protein
MSNYWTPQVSMPRFQPFFRRKKLTSLFPSALLPVGERVVFFGGRDGRWNDLLPCVFLVNFTPPLPHSFLLPFLRPLLTLICPTSPVPRNHSSDATPVMAFPDGLQMLTGNPFKRSYNSSSDNDAAIGFNCLGGNVEGETRKPYLPPYNCPDGLRAEIMFPSCWNGVSLPFPSFPPPPPSLPCVLFSY